MDLYQMLLVEMIYGRKKQCSALIPLPSLPVSDVSTFPDLRHILPLGSAVFQRGGSIPTCKFPSAAECANWQSGHVRMRSHHPRGGAPTLAGSSLQ